MIISGFTLVVLVHLLQGAQVMIRWVDLMVQIQSQVLKATITLLVVGGQTALMAVQITIRCMEEVIMIRYWVGVVLIH